jgi:hypothetical protein
MHRKMTHRAPVEARRRLPAWSGHLERGGEATPRRGAQRRAALPGLNANENAWTTASIAIFFIRSELACATFATASEGACETAHVAVIRTCRF